ncbi:GPW/gp25 family protein [Bradyrhizobium sp. Arg816]|uniref:GPW/gp25 family protein n=1 Tax=Bradyrhizobium sp. Arg816 TaxID=2998491 RepID=UPI00249F6508|nr:GPW/gp25 family protein [Bradyrhizobium sp. Arg816]MDI3560167.1 GPW/gp25 family protein [Bradyrhizobium sp. Arg816]
MDVAFPYHFDSRGRTASASLAYADHVRDLIEELIFTSPGERVNRPDLGTGLMQLVFSPNSPELAAALQFTLQAALQHWLGDIIQVRDLQANAEDSTLTVSIAYVILPTGQAQTTVFSRSV